MIGFPNGLFVVICTHFDYGAVHEFSYSAATTLEVLVITIGAGIAVWGTVNLMEGYGVDNGATNTQSSEKRNDKAAYLKPPP